MQQEVHQASAQPSTQAQLKSVVERIERLEEEKAALEAELRARPLGVSSVLPARHGRL